MACRFKVVGWLAKKFKSPLLAESALSSSLTVPDQDEKRMVHTVGIQASPEVKSVDIQTGVTNDYIRTEAVQTDSDPVFQKDFLSYASTAMRNLAASGRTNVLYNLAKGIGQPREDGTDSCFPIKRMPMGLLEYAADFFAKKNLNTVSDNTLMCDYEFA